MTRVADLRTSSDPRARCERQTRRSRNPIERAALQLRHHGACEPCAIVPLAALIASPAVIAAMLLGICSPRIRPACALARGSLPNSRAAYTHAQPARPRATRHPSVSGDRPRDLSRIVRSPQHARGRASIVPPLGAV